MNTAQVFLAESIQFTKDTLCDRTARDSAKTNAELEHRVMLSASPLDAAPQATAESIAPAIEANGSFRQELVIVDANADDALLEGIRESSDQPAPIVYRLNADEDGVVQIRNILSEHLDISTVHLVSHGASGGIQLGATWLSTESLAGYASDIASWGTALADGGDILIYGCDLASNSAGEALTDSMAALCDCDVAASDDLTGHASLGGDWDLEYHVGVVESEVLWDESFQATWTDVLATLVVTTVDDIADGDTSSISNLIADPGADGGISLREAIEAANNTGNGASPDEIHFNLAGTPTHRMEILNSALPEITEAVVIDGWTAPNFVDVPVIEIDGNQLSGNVDGLWVTGGDVTIRGLSIINFSGIGIHIETGGSNKIYGNYIGIAADGTAAGNRRGGIVVFDSAQNVIGGPTPGWGNVIGSNGRLIHLEANGITIGESGSFDNVVQGNLIGTDPTGLLARGNSFNGILIQNGAIGTLIGGATTAHGNVIAASVNDGIEILGALTESTEILNNFIGVGVDGTTDLGNGASGVFLEDSPNTILGAPTAGNTIGFNGRSGVLVSGDDATGNHIVANYIGTDATGLANLANARNGIHFAEFNEFSSSIGVPSANIVGGTTADEENIIAFNNSAGIRIESGQSIDVQRNQIYGNVGLAIDLGDEGLEPNDVDDMDSGANELQNFPQLLVATSGPQAGVRGSLHSTPDTTFDVDFFVSTTDHATGRGQVERYLGTIQVTTDNTGDTQFTSTLSESLATGEFVTAVARDPNGNTSETSPTVQAAVNQGPMIVSNGGGDTTTVNFPENATTVTTVAASDPDDAAADLRYSLVPGDDDAFFSIDELTGELVFLVPPDFETAQDNGNDNSYVVQVQAADPFGASDTQTLTIQVSNVNESPTEITLDDVSLLSGQLGAVVGQVAVSDPDASESHTFLIDDNRFEVVNGDLKLLDTSSIDGDVESTIPLTLTATDTAGNTLSESFTLTVSNQLQAQDDTYATDQSTVLNSDAANGLLVNDIQGPAAGSLLNYDATLDNDGDNLWQDSTGLTGFDWVLDTDVSRIANPTTAFAGIQASYQFTSTGASRGILSDALQDLPNDPTDNDASLELWFRPVESNRRQLIFESGSAAGDGMSLRLDRRTLEFAVWTGSTAAVVSHDILSEIDSGEFIQLAVNLDIGPSAFGLDMYINGVLVDSDVASSALNDWSDGTETAALATVDGGTFVVAPVANTGNFEGEIAIFRLYESTLSEVEIGNNFNALQTPPPLLTATNLDTTTDATRGNVTLSTDGSFQYDPNGAWDSLAAGETATDRFRYDAFDGSVTDTAIVEVTITGTNDAPTATGFITTLPENSANGTQVAAIVGTDVDNGDSLTYSIIGGNTGSAFAIDNAGNITVNDATQLDREARSQFLLQVEVRDTAGATTITSAEIDVLDVNDVVPVVTPNQSFPVAETASNGTSLGSLLATDGDVSPTTLGTWVIVGGHPIFEVVPSTGELRVRDNTLLDFESGTTSHTFDVTVSDGTNTSALESVTVLVTDVNEAPAVSLSNTVTTVPESLDTSSSVRVANIDIADDALGTNSLLLSGTDSGLFTIVVNSGQAELHIASGVSLNATTNPVLDVTVQVDDLSLGSSFEDSASLSISVSSTNTAPIAFPSTGTAYFVDEGSSITLNGLNSVDLDGTIAQYEWDLNYSGVFQVDATGATPIFDATTIDGPTTQTIALRVIDNDGLVSSVATTNVSVLNVAPIGGADSGSGFETDEQTPFVTGDVLLNDNDPAGSNDPFSITSIDVTGTLGSVTLQADGRSFLYAPSPLFRSLPGGASTTDTFRYILTDDDGASTSVPVTITIQGINQAPTATGFSTTLQENSAAGTVVGTVLSSDVDVNDPRVYAIVSGNTDNAFQVDGFGNILVNNQLALDREILSQFVLTVQVSDFGGLSDTATVQIDLLDENDNAPTINASSDFTVNENAPVGTTVGTLTAVDGDATASPFTWTLVSGNTDAIFSIGANTGEIRIADNSLLDFERTPNQYTLGIQANDGVNSSTIHIVNVAIAAINDNAPAFSGSLDRTIFENQSVVVRLTATDADQPTQTISFRIAGTGDDDALFTINAANQLVFRSPPDFENPLDAGGDNQYSVDVLADDGAGASTSTTVQVRIADLVEALPPSPATTPPSSSPPTDTPILIDTPDTIPDVSPNLGDSPDTVDPTPEGPVDRSGPTETVSQLATVSLPDDSAPTLAVDRGPNLLVRRAALLTSTDRSDETYRSATTTTYVSTMPFVSYNSIMWDELDTMGQQIQAEFVLPDAFFYSTTSLTSAFTVGYVMWLLKGGHILASVLAQVPAWRLIDPLPIMAHLDALGDEPDVDLQTLMEEADAEAAKSAN